MTDQPIDYKPQGNIIQESITQIIQQYTELKRVFFMNAAKNESPEALDLAGKAYGPLLNTLYTLLDLCKPDNRDNIQDINQLQDELSNLDTLINIDQPEITRLRGICDYIDTNPLSPHLRTQPIRIDL